MCDSLSVNKCFSLEPLLMPLAKLSPNELRGVNERRQREALEFGPLIWTVVARPNSQLQAHEHRHKASRDTLSWLAMQWRCKCAVSNWQSNQTSRRRGICVAAEWRKSAQVGRSGSPPLQLSIGDFWATSSSWSGGQCLPKVHLARWTGLDWVQGRNWVRVLRAR